MEQFAKEPKKMVQASNIGFLAFLLSMVEDEAAATLRRLSEQGGRAA